MIWWTMLLLFQQGQAPELPSKNPYTSAADIEHGKRLYNGRCAGCHGPSGEGGKGANLAQPVLPRASDDRALFRIIRSGIPDTEMPGSLMDTHEIWKTAAFVRSLGKVQASPIQGNPAAGLQLFRGKGGCIGCHAIGPDGGRTGPSLNSIGMRRSAAHIRNKILDPSSDIPESYRLVKVVTKDGPTLTGVRLNEDTWSIQLRDSADRFHSLWKSGVASITVEQRTPMPSYKGKLSNSELDDLVAYLAAQRSAQ